MTEFLSDGGTSAGQKVVTRKTQNWADDVENEEEFESIRKEVILPTAPRATRSPEVDDEKVPKAPPFQAYISNLPYEVDENDIYEFFKNLQVTDVRLPRDERKPKGYGYVEFENRNSLISALSMVDTMMKNRRMRIEVADNNDGDRRGRGGRDRGEMNRDRTDGPDRTLGDWRSRPKEESVPDHDERGGGFGRDRDGGYDRRGTGRRDFGSSGFRDGDRLRDNYGDRDHGYDNRDRGRFGGDRDRERDSYGDRDRFSSQRGGDRDRDFGGRSGFGARRYGPGSDYDRDGYRGRDDARDGYRGRDDAPPPEPRSRPRLNLKPRSTAEKPAAPAPVVAQASIFGGAKPVDTTAREKEIEERLQKERGEILRVPQRETANEDTRSKSGSEYGDRDDDGPSEKSSTPRKMEPAPPPKENVWIRRSQQSQGPRNNDTPDGNGRVSPHSDRSDHEQERGSRRDSPRRYQAPRPDSPRRYREPSDTDRRSQNTRGTPRRQYDRDDRGGSRGQLARGSGSGAPMRGSERHRGGKGDGRANADRDHRRDDPQDELQRMPKYHEHETPNFVGSNKFAYLPDEEDQYNDAD